MKLLVDFLRTCLILYTSEKPNSNGPLVPAVEQFICTYLLGLRVLADSIAVVFATLKETTADPAIAGSPRSNVSVVPAAVTVRAAPLVKPNVVRST